MEERKIIVNKCDVSGCEFYCRFGIALEMTVLTALNMC